MAKAKVVHSGDAVTVIFKGNPKHPEPSTGIIKFPGGHVEVSRTTDNQYWAHTEIYETGQITSSRLDYDYETYLKNNGEIVLVPEEQHLVKIAIKVNKILNSE